MQIIDNFPLLCTLENPFIVSTMVLPARFFGSHPLDTLNVEEVKAASQLLLHHLGCSPDQVRFKVVDLAEPPKDLTFPFLHQGGPAPDRKCRVYYHHSKSPVLSIAIVNLTKRVVERSYDAPDSQGPVDWVEYDLVHKACLSHPKVLAEIAKLKLPAK